MAIDHRKDFVALDTLSAALARACLARRSVALGLVMLLSVLGWAYLAQLVLSDAEEARSFFAALCSTPGLAAGSGLAGLGLTTAMWLAMVGAMMLPAAAPMVTTYAEIADTAARQGRKVAPVLALLGGYLAVWSGFALLAALGQWGTGLALGLVPRLELAGSPLAGALFILAGAYQFTPLKHACLMRCRSPFPVLFGRWSERPADIFRLGLQEGVYCLGCCWALMLLMFAVGVMNILWMVGIALVSIGERLTSGRSVPYGVGVVLILIGLAAWGGLPIGRAPG